MEQSTRKLIRYFVAAALLVVSFTSFYLLEGTETKEHAREVKAELSVRSERLKSFTFDDVYNSSFSYNSISPRWISESRYIYMNDNYDVIVRDADNLNDTVIMPGDVYTSNKAASYKVSSTQNYILLLTNYNPGWRHSYNGTYLIYDVSSKMIVNSSDPFPDDIQYITWSPVGDSLVYVHGFDMYYRESPLNTSKRITHDGKFNEIYNGIPDWVYEEEMISSNNVIYFSPDGKYVSFAQFNDTPCDHIKFTSFQSTPYPSTIDVSYPKAGTTQPTNKVYMVDTTDPAFVLKEILPPAALGSEDYLFNRVTWASPTRAAVSFCNRIQTHSVIQMCDVNDDGTWNCSTKEQYAHSSTTGWLYQRRPYWIPVFGRDQTEFFTVQPNKRWQHLARIDDTGKEFLTSGEYTVTSYSASYPAVEYYDSGTDYVYFFATTEGPATRQVYRQLARAAQDETKQCITCKLQARYEGRCNTISSSFSTDASFVVVGCRGEGPPIYLQFRVNHTATAEEDVLLDEEVLEDNADLVANVAETEMSVKEYGTINSTTGYEFHYEMWKPPNFDSEMTYPLLIDVYAGPGYQNVDAGWTRSWASVYVPAGLDVIVARIDGRGSNFYGDQFMHEVYLALGQKEIDDQIEAARFFGKLDFIDSSKIAIWGWSYGGFATSHAIGQGTDVFKCGLAVAPLTDWRYYDTIYAERYMGLPTSNVDGYDMATVSRKANDFPQSTFHLIHGTADDNVHFQNSAQLSKALIEADIKFTNFFYADQDHSINNGNANRHVYKLLTRELCHCFELPLPEDIWH